MYIYYVVCNINAFNGKIQLPKMKLGVNPINIVCSENLSSTQEATKIVLHI